MNPRHGRPTEEQLEKWKRQGVTVGTGCRIYGVHFSTGDTDRVTIGNDCLITSGVVFLTHDAAPGWFVKNGNTSRQIVVGDHCFIGYRATLLPGVIIGSDSIIGAGAVVTKDVPPGKVVAGNPAKVIGTTREYIAKHTRQKAEHSEWYPATGKWRPDNAGRK